jgi:hypothetical protein
VAKLDERSEKTFSDMAASIGNIGSGLSYVRRVLHRVLRGAIAWSYQDLCHRQASAIHRM